MISAEPVAAHPPAIAFDAIDKRFGAIHANRAISFSVARGEIHAIIGENGAGKSTLVSILSGFYQADSGRILMDGQERKIASPQEAIRLGIGMVHQHFMLVETLSVADNLLLGAEGGVWLSQGRAALGTKLDALARDYGLTIDPEALVSDLPVGLQQRVELLKALVRDAKILVLDEPTAVLTPEEADRLFVLLRDLKARGTTIILITHKLREVMAVADRITVLRQGSVVGTFAKEATSQEALAEAMVGHHVPMPERRMGDSAGSPVLEVHHLSVRDAQGGQAVQNISFTLHRGEILGVAGVAGNGQSALLEALAGLRDFEGSITLDHVPLQFSADLPAVLRARGVRHIPEDRLRYALVPTLPAWEAALIGCDVQDGLLIGRDEAKRRAATMMQDFDVRPADADARIGALSGGNQQKFVLGREISEQPQLLLVGQPTRGVDIGAIAAIHRRLIALRDAGVAILLVSVELDEILRLSDRIIVMQGGRIVGERRSEATNERDLGLLMGGAA